MAEGTTAMVETVLGPIPAQQLGFTLLHEHVVMRSPGVAENYPSTFPRAEIVTRAVDELQRLRAKGVRTLVDMTTVDLGRDIELLAEVSSRSGMQIVATTGVHLRVPPYFHPRSSERIGELFVHDVEQGIAGTGIKAGVIKCAVDSEGMTEPITKIVEAAAIAQKATGAPVSTHAAVANKAGLSQQDVFRRMRVAGERTVIGHSGDTDDVDYLIELLAFGSYLGMDRFGVEVILSTERRCATVARLCALGYSSRIVLSHDAFSFYDTVSWRYRENHLPNWRMDFILDSVLPRLAELGVTTEQVDEMTRVNPMRILVRSTLGGRL